MNIYENCGTALTPTCRDFLTSSELYVQPVSTSSVSLVISAGYNWIPISPPISVNQSVVFGLVQDLDGRVAVDPATIGYLVNPVSCTNLSTSNDTSQQQIQTGETIDAGFVNNQVISNGGTDVQVNLVNDSVLTTAALPVATCRDAPSDYAIEFGSLFRLICAESWTFAIRMVYTVARKSSFL